MEDWKQYAKQSVDKIKEMFSSDFNYSKEEEIKKGNNLIESLHVELSNPDNTERDINTLNKLITITKSHIDYLSGSTDKLINSNNPIIESAFSQSVEPNFKV